MIHWQPDTTVAKVEADVLVDGLTDRLADNCIHSTQLKRKALIDTLAVKLPEV